jgi:hypothetical protein
MREIPYDPDARAVLGSDTDALDLRLAGPTDRAAARNEWDVDARPVCPSGGLRAALLLLLACFLYRLAGKYGVGEVLAAAFAARCGAKLLSETPD